MDGHNSHYTRGFLQYAHEHQIIVLCYPAHCTHILQGLDVVVFATVKRCLCEERDKWEHSTGERFSKTNFLGIYGRAHLQALTPDNIKALFRKTGVWPFDPTVITPAMMAPSKETSCEGFLPIALATPVRVIAKLLQKLSLMGSEDTSEHKDDEGVDGDGSEMDGGSETESAAGHEYIFSDPSHGESEESAAVVETRQATNEEAVNTAITDLSRGSLAPLVASGPMTSSTKLHLGTANIIPMFTHSAALSIVPKTLPERLLLAVLHESDARVTFLEDHLVDLQAANILNEAYCSRIRGQLAFREDKKADDANGKGKGKLMGNGLPVLLIGDVFYEKVVEADKARKRDDQEKEKRKGERLGRAGVLRKWQKQQDQRAAVIVQRRLDWPIKKEEWEAEKLAAKAAGKRFTKKAPVLGLPPAILRPPKAMIDDAELELRDDNQPSDDDEASDDE